MKRELGFYMGLAHRVSGLALFLYLFMHIVALRGLFDPPGFEKEMKFLDNLFGLLIEWGLGAAIFYHAFNGVRLIAIELFGQEGRQKKLFWGVLAAMVAALALMGIFMATAKDSYEAQRARFGIFWVGLALLSATPAYLAVEMIRQKMLGRHTVWKIQRLTGLILVTLVVGHYVFMHLTFNTGHDYKTILERMSSPLVRALDFVLLVVAYGHGTYGVVTILKDYLKPSLARKAIEAAVYLSVVVFTLLGASLLWSLPYSAN
ncbi:MAG: succinate dehydrogenase, cytochrome b556 subunit [Planctomycetes bacterium]|nr:succinate dehydrogenase, cytochrome b556 subunit [Planctomycetota bacterium]